MNRIFYYNRFENWVRTKKKANLFSLNVIFKAVVSTWTGEWGARLVGHCGRTQLIKSPVMAGRSLSSAQVNLHSPCLYRASHTPTLRHPANTSSTVDQTKHSTQRRAVGHSYIDLRVVQLKKGFLNRINNTLAWVEFSVPYYEEDVPLCLPRIRSRRCSDQPPPKHPIIMAFERAYYQNTRTWYQSNSSPTRQEYKPRPSSDTFVL